MSAPTSSSTNSATIELHLALAKRCICLFSTILTISRQAHIARIHPGFLRGGHPQIAPCDSFRHPCGQSCTLRWWPPRRAQRRVPLRASRQHWLSPAAGWHQSRPSRLWLGWMPCTPATRFHNGYTSQRRTSRHEGRLQRGQSPSPPVERNESSAFDTKILQIQAASRPDTTWPREQPLYARCTSSIIHLASCCHQPGVLAETGAMVTTNRYSQAVSFATRHKTRHACDMNHTSIR